MSGRTTIWRQTWGSLQHGDYQEVHVFEDPRGLHAPDVGFWMYCFRSEHGDTLIKLTEDQANGIAQIFRDLR